mmetsp:Transcript_15759/g.34091  ORF Transcript_15759/g.34091 Transcript_15759/m.34091 type:complete len:587 (-) Transcript_15759:454-2214(-)
MTFLGFNVSVSLTLPHLGATGPNNARPNALFEAIRTERWLDALDLLENAPPRSTKARRPGPGGDGLLPLHMLCWLGAGGDDRSSSGDNGTANGSEQGSGSDSNDENETSNAADEERERRRRRLAHEVDLSQLVLRALLRAYPGAARKKDNMWSWTPLHMACYSARSSVRTVDQLLAVHPAACSIRDEQRLVPLHRACLMASNDVDKIIRSLLHADPTQVNVEIRNGQRDVPFHLVVARIHHEIQKDRFRPLRMQRDSSSNLNGVNDSIGSSSRRNSSSSINNGNVWPYHDSHPQLEKLIEATFLILEAEARGTIGDGYISKQRKVELLHGCLRNCRCPNQRLFAYMALWDHPELVTMNVKSSSSDSDSDEGGDGDEGLLLHVAAGHAKHDIADCHWCAACNRGLADPHFVSQDNGESCDLTCAYRKRAARTSSSSATGGDNENESGEGADGVDGGISQQMSSWYSKYKDRMYKDVVLTMPYGCILKQIANLYPQAAETKAKDGNLPLHVAIGKGHTWIPGIQAIYRSFPGAGRVRDVKTGLYPFQMAAAKKPGPVDDDEWDRKRYLSELTTAYELLRADPDVILEK